jgi:hypothetical protein
MHREDYIPRDDKSFLEWAENFVANLSPSVARFGFPEDRFKTLGEKLSDFTMKLRLADNPMTRTKGTVQAKNESREDLEHTIRQDVKQYLAFNDAVTNKDKDDLKLPVYKTTRTPSPVAAGFPAARLDTGVLRRLTFHFSDAGSESHAKPPGQHGVEMRWMISDEPVVDVSKLTHSTFDTHSPLTLEFEGHDRGKTVYYALCWENTRGEKGPWSEINSAVIP